MHLSQTHTQQTVHNCPRQDSWMKKIRTAAATHISHTHSTQYITAPGRTRKSCTTAATHVCHTLKTTHHCLTAWSVTPTRHSNTPLPQAGLRSSALLPLLMQPVPVTNTPVTQTTSLPQTGFRKICTNWTVFWLNSKIHSQWSNITKKTKEGISYPADETNYK